VKLATLLIGLGSVSLAQTMFRGDASHTGASASQAPRSFHRVKWKFPTGNKIVSSPVFHEGTLFFGSDDGNLYAVDAATGRQKWKFVTEGPVSSTPAVAGGLVFFLSYDGKFYAVDEPSGKLRWKFATAGERRFEAKGLHGMLPLGQTFPDPYDVYLSSPAVADSVVYFGSGDGRVYALDAASGTVRWRFQTGDVVHASPAVSGGIVYFGSWDSLFYAVDARTGQEKWRFQGGQDPLIHNQVGFQSSPAVVDGLVYTGCRDSNVYALDATTGKEKWRANNAGSWVNSAPAVAGGKVYYATSDSSLFHAVEASTGKPVFRQQLKAFVFSSPVVAGDVVLVGILNGTLEARDRDTGNLLWSYQTETARHNRGWVLTAEGKLNNSLTFVNHWHEANLVAADRQFAIGGFFATPLVVDGVVYVGSADGALYAVD
jgi:outer membrane protein assembly factor BamB